MARTPLFDPEAFFRERSDPSLLLPTAVVLGSSLLLVAVLAADLAWGVASGSVSLSTLPFDAAERELVWIGLTVLLVAPLVAWWIDTAIMLFVAKLLGGTGSYNLLLAYVGWGHLPFVLETVAYATLGLIGFSQPYPAVDRAIALAGALWAGYVWVFAVKVGQNVTLWRAIVAAVVPTAISAWFAVTMIGGG